VRVSQIFFVQTSNVIYRLALQKKTDSELFIVDTKGDDKGMHSRHFPHKSSHIILVFLSVRKSLPRFSRTTLRSHQIISRRSAVPAVHARPRRSLVSSREKERLLKIARKDRRGPLNSIVDSLQPGEGSALLEVSEAVKQCGQYDMWSAKAKTRLDDDVNVKVWHIVPFTFHPSPKLKICPCPASYFVGTGCPQSPCSDCVARSSCTSRRNVV
jgi:nucleolar protein 53